MRIGLQAIAVALVGLAATACRTASGESTLASDTPAAAAPLPNPAPNPQWQKIEQTAVNTSNYTMLVVPSGEIEDYMVPGSDVQGVPANLQGIWWMDGNKLAPGNVTSFAETLWDFPNHRMLIQEYGANNYTLNGDQTGINSFLQSASQNICFEVQFDDDYTHGDLIEVWLAPDTQLAVHFPTALINYKMDYVADGDWLRTSWWGPERLPDYHLIRIVDGAGNRIEPAYTNFLQAAPTTSYIPELKPYTQSGSGTVSTIDP